MGWKNKIPLCLFWCVCLPAPFFLSLSSLPFINLTNIKTIQNCEDRKRSHQNIPIDFKVWQKWKVSNKGKKRKLIVIFKSFNRRRGSYFPPSLSLTLPIVDHHKLITIENRIQIVSKGSVEKLPKIFIKYAKHQKKVCQRCWIIAWNHWNYQSHFACCGDEENAHSSFLIVCDLCEVHSIRSSDLILHHITWICDYFVTPSYHGASAIT